MDKANLFRRKVKILIIEDNRMSAELLYEIIGGQFDRIVVRTGKDALYKYKTFSPDIVFLDLELPDISGHAVLDQIRSIHPDKYVVIVTGKGTKKNVEAALENKVQGFLCKPYSRDKILKHINTVSYSLEHKRKQAQDRVIDNKINKDHKTK